MPESSLGFWLSSWTFEPSIIIGLVVLYVGYLIATARERYRFKDSEPLTSGQFTAFTAGVVVLFFALLSPIDLLGDDYLFSAHMTQHMLLTLVAPPLLLLGTPGWLFHPLRRSRRMLQIARFFANPYLGFLSFNVVFSIWHVPNLYDAALASEPIHIVEHLSFIATALLTLLPVMSPTALFPRLAPPVQVLYLFLQSLLPTALGAIIAFDAAPLYSFYVQAPRLWGLTVMEDQLYAGLIMWIGGALFWLLALTIVFFKWFNRQEPVEGQGFI
jgi:putative membrane protein